MKKPQWLINLVNELKASGAIKPDQTGEFSLKINLTQGGIQDAKIMVGESIR